MSWLFLYTASITAEDPPNNYFDMALEGFLFLKFNFNNSLSPINLSFGRDREWRVPNHKELRVDLLF